MYTHLASGFSSGPSIDRRFRVLMTRLASKNGWFVPVATLLDHLSAVNGLTVLEPSERRALEWRWLRSKARVGYT